METHHLYHLAACWSAKRKVATIPPLTTSSALPEDWKNSDSSSGQSGGGTFKDSAAPLAAPDTVIKAAAAQMVFAARSSRAFISPDEVNNLENWTGKVRIEMFPLIPIPLFSRPPPIIFILFSTNVGLNELCVFRVYLTLLSKPTLTQMYVFRI